MSTKPGVTSLPVASISFRPAGRPRSIAAILPFETPTSARARGLPVPSTTMPPRITRSKLGDVGPSCAIDESVPQLPVQPKRAHVYTRAVGGVEDTSESPSGVAGSLLAELEAGGELVDTGGFTIDTVDARRKLREHLLADPHAYVLLLVEAAVICGANSVRIETEGPNVRVELGPLWIAAEELEQLFVAVFIDLDEVDAAERDRRRALQLLAYACNAALRLQPPEIEIVAADGRGGAHRLRLRPDDDRGVLERVEGELGSTWVRVERQDSRERELI